MQRDDGLPGPGSACETERSVVLLAVGDRALRGVKVGPPGGEVALQHATELVIGVEVDELHPAGRALHRNDGVVAGAGFSSPYVARTSSREEPVARSRRTCCCHAGRSPARWRMSSSLVSRPPSAATSALMPTPTSSAGVKGSTCCAVDCLGRALKVSTVFSTADG